MKPTRVAFVSSESAPFAKTGGLADVSSALPQFLHRHGLDVRPFLPLYGQVERAGREFAPVTGLQDIPLSIGTRSFTFSVVRSVFPGTDLPAYFIDCPALYARGGIYTSDPDEHTRFILFSRAAIESCRRMRWAPDIFHCHDWQTGLVPLYLKALQPEDGFFAKTASILTIHNLGYPGLFPASILPEMGLDGRASMLDQEDLRGGRINFLLTGILHAQWLTTVSPTYAREIQTEEYGAGLEGVLRGRSDRLTGILNGVDYSEWSPESDPYIAENYSAATLDRKEVNKRALLEGVNLPYSPRVLTAGIVSRLATQKGLELVIEPLREALAAHDMRFVVLGTGEPRYETLLAEMQREFPGKVCFSKGFSNQLAHLIEAGSDIFLMPSRYEPCGLNQMYSMKYGTIPVVRRTGGLADTVEHFDSATGRGTGFVFEHFTAQGLRWALGEAMKLFPDQAAWRRLMLNAMARDYSWEEQGKQYLALYEKVASGGNGRP